MWLPSVFAAVCGSGLSGKERRFVLFRAMELDHAGFLRRWGVGEGAPKAPDLGFEHFLDKVRSLGHNVQGGVEFERLLRERCHGALAKRVHTWRTSRNAAVHPTEGVAMAVLKVLADVGCSAGSAGAAVAGHTESEVTASLGGDVDDGVVDIESCTEGDVEAVHEVPVSAGLATEAKGMHLECGAAQEVEEFAAARQQATDNEVAKEKAGSASASEVPLFSQAVGSGGGMGSGDCASARKQGVKFSERAQETLKKGEAICEGPLLALDPGALGRFNALKDQIFEDFRAKRAAREKAEQELINVSRDLRRPGWRMDEHG